MTDDAVTRGIEFLRSAQQADGSFRLLRGSGAELTDGEADPSPFVTTFVLSALGGTLRDRADSAEIRGRAAGYLRTEMSPGGLWRYWSRRYWKHFRVPPDLDDTATASHALAEHGGPDPGNRAFIASLRSEDGRFYTWVMPRRGSSLRLRVLCAIGDVLAVLQEQETPGALRGDPRFTAARDRIVEDDVDLVVNVNVIRYLGERPETRAAIDWVVREIERGIEPGFSLYYPDPLALYHAVARAYRSGIRSFATLARQILDELRRVERADGSLDSALATALATVTRQAFGPLDAAALRAREALRAQQRDDGSWARYAYYGGPDEFWGSEELTTAIAIEALGLSTRT